MWWWGEIKTFSGSAGVSRLILGWEIQAE